MIKLAAGSTVQETESIAFLVPPESFQLIKLFNEIENYAAGNCKPKQPSCEPPVSTNQATISAEISMASKLNVTIGQIITSFDFGTINNLNLIHTGYCGQTMNTEPVMPNLVGTKF